MRLDTNRSRSVRCGVFVEEIDFGASPTKKRTSLVFPAPRHCMDQQNFCAGLWHDM